jgi:iron complex transport system permease protein
MVAVLLGAAYVALAVGGTLRGSTDIPAAHLPAILTGSDDPAVPEAERFIVLRLRLPQMLLLGLAGAALAASGAALQATFENPLADPGVLGVTGGAALGGVIAIHTGLAEKVFLALPMSAFAGAAGAAAAVYGLNYLAARPGVTGLVLTGVIVGGLTGACVSLVMLMTAEYRVAQLLFWMMGGIRHQTWEHVAMAAGPAGVGLAWLMLMHRRLDALLMGEEHAAAVGVPVAATRLSVMAAAALAVGAVTAATGGIGFVGLIVPHIVRPFTGPATLRLLPACLTGGAAFLTAAELAARNAPTQTPLPVGLVTAMLGGPFFLLVLRRSAGGMR